jgi:hypothetical protein
MKRGLTPPAEGSSEGMPWTKNPKEVCRERRPTVVAQEDRLGYLAYRCPTVPPVDLAYGLTIPLSAGLLVLVAPGLVPRAGHADDRGHASFRLLSGR